MSPNASSKPVSSFQSLATFLPDLKELSPESIYLLGAPIFPSAVPKALQTCRDLLLLAGDRLGTINPHSSGSDAEVLRSLQINISASNGSHLVI